MRRNEFFEMLPRPRKCGGKRIDSDNKPDSHLSYFSQMTPEKDAPSFSRRKGASAASARRRQSSAEKAL